MALVMNTVLSVEQRLSKAMADIMAVDPAIAPVLMIGKRVVCDKTQTACTNGRDEKYGRAFCEALSDAELPACDKTAIELVRGFMAGKGVTL